MRICYGKPMTLEQILVEIEQRGYVWDLYQTNSWEDEDRKYNISLRPIGRSIEDDEDWFGFKTPLEAAGQALSWILEQEGER